MKFRNQKSFNTENAGIWKREWRGEYSVTSINFIAFQKRNKDNYYIIEFQYNCYDNGTTKWVTTYRTLAATHTIIIGNNLYHIYTTKNE
jgi:hypothetical protein